MTTIPMEALVARHCPEHPDTQSHWHTEEDLYHELLQELPGNRCECPRDSAVTSPMRARVAKRGSDGH